MEILINPELAGVVPKHPSFLSRVMMEPIQLETIHPATHSAKSNSVRHIIHQNLNSSPAEHAGTSPPEVEEVVRPVANPESSFVQTRPQRIKGRIQLIVLSFTLFLNGWNDGTTGPLLPKMQEVYRVSDTIVSLVFISACLGFVSGACLNVAISERLGFGKVIVLGSVMQILAYSIQSGGPPFPVFVTAYAINGAGIALQEAQANSFVASLKKRTEIKLALLHALCGLGAFAAPLVATQFSQLDRWSFHFLISLGIAITNTTLLAAIFRFKSQEREPEIQRARPELVIRQLNALADCLEQIGQPVGEHTRGGGAHLSFKQILVHRNVHLMAFFLMVYNGGTGAGYISSGFFGGLALGRVALLWFNSLVSEQYVIYIYATLAIGLEFIVWFVPSLVGGAVAVSIVGFFLGPIYPITMNHAGLTLPRWILAGAIGWMAGFGQAGTAVFPFMTGALAGKFGIESLQPLLIAMMVTMTILWGVINVAGRRRKD
ncbi:hypothetical protein V5O48_011785 [Marasmius crinis-equi]|uniref:Major facilitator superfamily (MFS) profile domain-containing protein n=1 Tax=Marasmius crinis-equi TaxID=585013 RepID=A0ABR3F4P0_9AGAR